MSKNNENKLVPKLRFPTFENEEDWKIVSLDKVVSDFIVPMRDKPKKLDGEIPWCRIEDFDGMYLAESKSNQGVNYDTVKEMNLKVYPISTLLVSCSADLGRCAITKRELITNQTFIGLVPVFDKVDVIYLYFLMSNSSRELNARASGTTISYLSRQKFETYEIVIPKLKEQQKIAACLSSLDEVITAENQKLELYKEHKKGLLQNLLPQEGETVPNYRFQEFYKDGEWVSDILKNVFSIFQGFAFSSSDSVSNGVRWLKIADVGIQQMNHLAPSYLPYEYKEKYKNFLIKEGDYVIALTRPILNKKLKISKVDNALHDSLLNQRVGKLVSNKCIDFVYYLIQTSKLISSIEQNIAGSEPPNLSSQQIENIEVFIPPTIEEQQKIANTLSSIDDLINAQSQKIEALKEHKKGLLQGLFPIVPDVKTGHALSQK